MRVLVVDDNPDDAEIIKRNVKKNLKEESSIISVENPKEALKKALDGFDIILLDYRLGEKTGLDILTEFTEAGLDTPVVFLTGQGNEDVAIKALSLGAYDYFTKDLMSSPRLVQSMVNIHIRYRAEKELKRAFEELKAADEMKDNFLAITSHELKTPLTPIMIYSEMLLDRLKDLDDESRGYLKSIHSQALHLDELIQDILELAKLDGSHKHFNFQPHDITEIVDEAIEEVADMASVKKITLSKEFETDLPSVSVDWDSIKMVVENLLTNAVKYSEEQTNVAVSVRSNEAEILVEVRDEGIGIPENLHEKVFDRFYQVGEGKKRVQGGTGLGLAICRGNIEAHGGWIKLESKLEMGSTFTFALPIGEHGGT
jgi:two-component system CheB/CheR fusion protein